MRTVRGTLLLAVLLACAGSGCTSGGRSAEEDQRGERLRLSRGDEIRDRQGDAEQRGEEAAKTLMRAFPGLERGPRVTRDRCAGWSRGDGPEELRCRTRSTYYFVVDGKLPDVLPRLARAAALAGVGMPQDQGEPGSLGAALHGKGDVFLGYEKGRGGTLRWDDPERGALLPPLSPSRSDHDDGKGYYRQDMVYEAELKEDGKYIRTKSLRRLRQSYDLVVAWRPAPDQYARLQHADD